MTQRYLLLSASVAAILASAPATLPAYPAAPSDHSAHISVAEAPRVKQAVNSGDFVTLAKTHLAFLATASAGAVPLPANNTMRHLQLVLKPSLARRIAMEAFIANLHNPKSASFQKWLTPIEFGNAYGLVDSDIAAVTSWLTSQGFTVNNVYPNKTQIDFSGSVAQVNQAFHSQEQLYTLGEEKRWANATDITVPAALGNVIVGVMGLNNLQRTSEKSRAPMQLAQWDARSKRLRLKANTSSSPKGMAITADGGEVRGLAPNDIATIYNVKPLRANGVTGKGLTLAIAVDAWMEQSSWSNFVNVFNLAQYGGSFSRINPAPSSGNNNCFVPPDYEALQTVEAAEWATAVAPGLHVEVAACYDLDASNNFATSNDFGGFFIAAENLINSETRPDIITTADPAPLNEHRTDGPSKAAIDLMWAQADAEGISVFVASGDTGTQTINPFANEKINGEEGPGVSADALATSPHITAVGATDFADVLDGTTSQYFAATPSVVGGSALSYVPEIPWNNTCGNGVAATSLGFRSAIAFCQTWAVEDPQFDYANSAGTGGAPSSIDPKPSWQPGVFNAVKDASRDIPDVALFGGSYGRHTFLIVCMEAYPCFPSFEAPFLLTSGTIVSSSMFAGIQALMDQGLAMRGLPADQGNAAPTLYALAAKEYGGPSGATPSTLAACSADNGTRGTDACIFHNVTRGSNSVNCIANEQGDPGNPAFTTSNCYYYGTTTINPPFNTPISYGLTTSDATPTGYGVTNKAFGAQPGWSFASGLGSVNAKNLLIAWRAYANAPPAN